jgi:hypothetical protein
LPLLYHWQQLFSFKRRLFPGVWACESFFIGHLRMKAFFSRPV